MIRIAVVGAGLIGRRHCEEIRRNAACTLAAVVEPIPDADVDAFDAPLYPSLDALLGHGGCVDGVIVATPNRLHVEHGLRCIDAGLAVLIEKPLADSIADAWRLVDAAERRGVPLLVGHHRRHSPIVQAAVDVVRSGELGALVAVQGSALFYKPDDYFAAAPWRTRPGGGPILINLVHEIDSLRALAGEIVAVQAFTSNAARGFAVEDSAAIGLRFAGGALGSFLLSDSAASPYSWEQTSQENPIYAANPDRDCYLVVGTNGSLAVPTLRLNTYAAPQQRSWREPFTTRVIDVERADPLARQIEHFAAVVRGEAEPLVSGRDGLQNLRVVDAIVRSARSAAAVALD